MDELTIAGGITCRNPAYATNEERKHVNVGNSTPRASHLMKEAYCDMDGSTCKGKAHSHNTEELQLAESPLPSALPLECEEQALLVVGKMLRAAKEQNAVAISGNPLLKSFLPGNVLLSLHNSSCQANSTSTSVSRLVSDSSSLSVWSRKPDGAASVSGVQNSVTSVPEVRERVPFESMRIRAVTEKLRNRKKAEAVLIREVPLSVVPNNLDSENLHGEDEYVRVEPASPVEKDSSIAKWVECDAYCPPSQPQPQPQGGLLPQRKPADSVAHSEQLPGTSHSACGRARGKKADTPTHISAKWRARNDSHDLPDDGTVEHMDSADELGMSNAVDSASDEDDDCSPHAFAKRKSASKAKSKVRRSSMFDASGEEPQPEPEPEVDMEDELASSSTRARRGSKSSASRTAKYASNANAEWRVLHDDEVDANAVSRSRLKQLVRELAAEHTQAQAQAHARPRGNRLFVKRISELMRERYRILILEGSVRTLIMQADLVRLRSGEYVPFDGDSDTQTLRSRIGEVGCAAMLRERAQRSQVESVLTELAAANRVVRTRELMRTCRARFRLPRDRYFYNHVAHKLGFVYNWNLQSWVRRGDDVSDLVGRLAKLNEELKGVAKVFANREANDVDSGGEDDDAKPGVLVVDDQHVEMAVRRAAGSILDKARVHGTFMTADEFRAALRAHQVDAEIVQNDEFVQFMFEEAGFALSNSSCKFEPLNTPRRSAAAPKWFRCWLMNKILTRLFADDTTRQSVHYYELQAEAFKVGVQLRLVRQVFLMYALDDFYMVEHRWVPIDERFTQLLNATRDTLTELRAQGVQVTKAVLLAELDRRGMKPQERGMPKLLERIGYTFSYLDHSYVPVDSKLKMK